MRPRYEYCTTDAELSETDRLLASSYAASLECGKKAKLEAVAFSLLCAGATGAPKSREEILRIGLEAICGYSGYPELREIYLFAFMPGEESTLLQLAEDLGLSGLETIPDNEDAPIPAVQTSARCDEEDKTAKAAEMDNIIQAVINDPDRAPMSAAQVAVVYEEIDNERRTPRERRLELIADCDAPVPIQSMPDQDDLELQKPSPAVPPASNEAESNVQCPRSSDQQQVPVTRRPLPSSVLGWQGSDSSACTPMLEATLVEDEPSLPVYNAVVVASNESNNGEPEISWCKKHQRCITIVSFFFAAALIAILGASLIPRSGGNSVTTPAPMSPPSLRPTGPPSL